MKSIMQWLSDNGYIYKTVRLTSGDTGIMVNTDYAGPYPTKECWSKQDVILHKVHRCKTFEMAVR